MVRKLLLKVKSVFSFGRKTVQEPPPQPAKYSPQPARRQQPALPHERPAKKHDTHHKTEQHPPAASGPSRPRHAPRQQHPAHPPRQPSNRREDPKRAVHDPNWTPADFISPPEEGKVRFHDLTLPDPIMHAICDLGFKYCTPIQAKSLPHTLKGNDLLGKAQTGTGKTAAFLLTALDRFYREANTPASRPRSKGSPRVLILAPTRELVIQIIRDADELSKYLPIRSLAIFGGTDFRKQKEALHDNIIDLVAATPGRLLDFHQNHDINLRDVDLLVLDEADRMLDMGFIPDVRRIIRAVPDKEHRQTLFFSATLNDTVKSLATQWTRNPVEIEIEPENVAVDTVAQSTFLMRSNEKLTVLFNVIKVEKPVRTLVFCNRRDTAEHIADCLKAYDIRCALLSGSVNQTARMKTLDDFRAGAIPVVVATDVAGRGIHVDGIDLVINFDVPHEPESYVHRIGRTGRAGAAGRSYTFACEEEAFSLPEIEAFLGRPLVYSHPNDALLTPLPPSKHPFNRTRPQRSGPPQRYAGHGGGRRPGGPSRPRPHSSRPRR